MAALSVGAFGLELDLNACTARELAIVAELVDRDRATEKGIPWWQVVDYCTQIMQRLGEMP